MRGQAGDVTPSAWAQAIGRTNGRYRHPPATATFSTSGLTAVYLMVFQTAIMCLEVRRRSRIETKLPSVQGVCRVGQPEVWLEVGVRRLDHRVLPHCGGNWRTNRRRRLMRSGLWAADLVLHGDCEKRDGHGQLSRAEDSCGKLTTSFSTTKASGT